MSSVTKRAKLLICLITDRDDLTSKITPIINESSGRSLASKYGVSAARYHTTGTGDFEEFISLHYSGTKTYDPVCVAIVDVSNDDLQIHSITQTLHGIANGKPLAVICVTESTKAIPDTNGNVSQINLSHALSALIANAVKGLFFLQPCKPRKRPTDTSFIVEKVAGIELLRKTLGAR